MPSVEPNDVASSSFRGTVSTAMIRSDPASNAPWITFNPTPPTPNTATLLPAVTAAVLNTAPTPVITAQPISAALSSGASSGSFTHALAGATTISESAPSPQKA